MNVYTSVTDAASRLVSGEVVGLPTETVYGLAADALNPTAVAQIFALKGRPTNHPLITHIAANTPIEPWVDGARMSADMWDVTHALIDAFWPGPLTLVLPKAPHIDATVTGGQDTIALRSPDHALFQAVLQEMHRLKHAALNTQPSAANIHAQAVHSPAAQTTKHAHAKDNMPVTSAHLSSADQPHTHLSDTALQHDNLSSPPHYDTLSVAEWVPPVVADGSVAAAAGLVAHDLLDIVVSGDLHTEQVAHIGSVEVETVPAVADGFSASTAGFVAADMTHTHLADVVASHLLPSSTDDSTAQQLASQTSQTAIAPSTPPILVGIAAPSANRFGRVSPTRAEHVIEEFDGQVIVLDGDASVIGIESTIIDLTRDTPIVLRHGHITPDDIFDVTGLLPVAQTQTVGQGEAPRASGTMLAHYAPATPLVWASQTDVTADDACLYYQAVGLMGQSSHSVALDADAKGYARHLYHALRQLDWGKYPRIVVQDLPNESAWDAVRDRLKRAIVGSNQSTPHTPL